ncbi:MAG: electron transfer flavoprotein subunit beta/FixA family protein [Chloroflexota bacterium]
MLNIIVCAKVVLDPEAPVSTFKIDPRERHVLPGPGVPPVLNPYDENCLEAALKIKEAQPARITVISAGKNIPKAVVRKCLAVGADDLVVLEDEAFDEIDSLSTAILLAAAIRKLGEYDLVLTGRMAADTNAGQVGPGLAERLAIPAVTVARKIEVNSGTARVERVRSDGYEVIEVALPCLVTVSHEIGELRAATVKGLMAAQKQPLTTWHAADLAPDATDLKQRRPQKLFIPDNKVACELVIGATPEEAGAGLALKIQQIGRI